MRGLIRGLGKQRPSFGGTSSDEESQQQLMADDPINANVSSGATTDEMASSRASSQSDNESIGSPGGISSRSRRFVIDKLFRILII